MKVNLFAIITRSRSTGDWTFSCCRPSLSSEKMCSPMKRCIMSFWRGADRFISDVFLYKSKEEALAKMKEQMDYKADSIDFCEENMVIHGGDPTNPSGVTVAIAKATDYYNGIYTWKINEYEVEL